MHSKRGTSRDVLLNVDLLGLTPVYITHLDRWKPFFHSAIEEAFVRRLIHRYEHYWLPLLAIWQQLDLEPPADIHWIWQLHMLQPNHYATYCRDRFTRILPHRIRKYDRESAIALQRTASLWKDTYPGTPFEADLDYLRSNGVQLNGTKLGDLVEIALNEREFLHQIGLPHYRDQNFQYAAVERYKKLLLFKSIRPSEVLRLPVDVQLVWRVHLLHPIQYAEDIRRIFGNPVSQIGEMDFEAHFMLIAESNNVWREEFGDELFVEGTGYRGQESNGIAIYPFPRENYDKRAIESCEISLENLMVEEIWTKEKKIIVEAKLIGDNSFAQQTVFRTHGTVGSAMGGEGPASAKVSGNERSMGKTHFDTRLNKGLEFHIFGRKGLGCISREHTVATKLFNPAQYFHNLQSLSGGSQLVVLPKVTYTDPKISFQMTVKAAAPKPHIFTLDRNPSELGPIAPDFRHFAASLQPWAATTSTPGDNQFLRARHSLKCREAGIAFGVEVIKHDPSNLAAVLLYHNNNRLVAIAYSVDGTELPNHNQVLETCPVVFNRHDGDHAMIIRNQNGDFAVCIAKWIGSSTGEGRVVVRTYYVQTRLTHTLEIRDDELQSIRTDAVTIDLPTGRLTIDSTCDWLPEQICWAFCVGTLFVIAQKTSSTPYPSSLSNGSVRSAQWSSTSDPDSESLGTSGTTKKSKLSAKAHINQKKMAKRRKMSASFTFLLACGLQIDHTLYGSNSRPPSSRSSPGPPRPSGEREHIDDVTYLRGDPVSQLSNGIALYTPNGIKNADPGRYAFQQTDKYSVNSNGTSSYQQPIRQVAPATHNGKSIRQEAPATHNGNTDSSDYYVDVRL